ncbi:radical SAM family heme chaperone HemW [Bifidobacterium coryneforme]|uniref:radical SAM family heme chaperone HemW n=1 Tax=Bifidobacterium coryneforme TaxID=1687 RepID=UPI0023F0A0C3|nr:radical SAM family heme chaperone HemW [Bifidobacterium coryneforme]
MEERPPFEVYIHVPFCLRRCGYCDFNTYTATDLGGGASRGNYADLAIREMRMAKAWQESRGITEPAISSIFFGGGTPTILPPGDLVRMVRAAGDLWGLEEGAEITTEANPDTVDAAYLETLLRGGFTRVSFGMQSAVSDVLKTLDRTHTPANVDANVQAARSLGLEASVDLIYGTPGESLEDWRTSIEAALDLGVDHVSAYALTLEPTTKMGRAVAAGRLPGPNDDDEAAKYELADDLLSAAGLGWYEVSNWSRPGYECRHNLGYWHNVDWAGIGPGAHSHYLPAEAGSERRGDDLQSVSAASAPASGFRRTNSPEVASTGSGELQDPCNIDDTASPGAVRDDEVTLPWWQRPHPDSHELTGASLRSWDISHPRAWAESMSHGLIPWQGAEVLTGSQNLEETVMLGLRLSEGLDLNRLETMSGRRPSREVLQGLIHQGLVEVAGPRVTTTRQGRLLNDLVVERVLESIGTW